MCAPHQATTLADCTAEEAVYLLAVAGFNANREFLDLYLRTEPQTQLTRNLRRIAESKDVLRERLISLPDDPEGGRRALAQMRQFLSGHMSVSLDVVKHAQPSSCCHKG